MPFRCRFPQIARLTLAAGIIPAASSFAQPVQSAWNSATEGAWTQASHWSTNPYYPNNNNPPGTQYNAIINAGTAFYHIQLTDPIALNQFIILDPNVTIDHNAGTLTLTSDLEIVNGHYRLSGATISGGAIYVGPQANAFTATDGGASGTVHPRLQGVTVNGDLNGGFWIRDGFTLNGTMTNAFFVAENTCSFNNGTVLFPNGGTGHGFAVADGETLTLSTTLSGGESPGVRIGEGLNPQISATNGIVNRGRIFVDNGGMEIWSSTFVNEGALTASNVGVLNIGLTGGFASNVAQVFGTVWSNIGVIRLIGNSSSGPPPASINLGGSTTTAGLGKIERTGGNIYLWGVIDNTNSILNLSPSDWSLTVRGGSIIGGTINIARGGGFGVSLYNNTPFILDGVRINGGFNVAAGQNITIRHGLELNGQMTLRDLFHDLTFDGTQTLTGGLILGIPSSSGSDIVVLANSTLTLSPTTVIQANAFYFGGYPGAAVVNLGTIASTGFAGLSVPTGPLRFRNDGIVDATAGNIKLGLSTSIDNISQNTLTGGIWRVGPGTGGPPSSIAFVSDSPVLTTNAADVTIAGSGSFPALEGLSLNQGAFRLRQSHDESCPSGLTNTGLLDLGAGCDVNATGQFSQGDQGTLSVELGGTTPFTQYAAVHATVSASLAGTLVVHLVSTFVPSLGNQFDIVTAPSLSGSFATVQLPVISSTRQLQVSYLPDRVRLTVIPANCYANCDESVVQPFLNANDFQCFLNAFAAGNPYANCDGSTTDPVLNANDFACFLNAFAAGCP
jgi:hypothetical protein